MTKAEQRKAAECARKALTERQRTEYSAAICRRLLDFPELSKAGTVLSYMAFGAECDLSPLHRELTAMGKTLCFPVCGSAGLMEAYAQSLRWTVSRYGISEPDVRASRHIDPAEIDLVLVPCVAFDETRQRIGWGAGYYDRFLPNCCKAKAVIAAFEAQKVDIIQAEAFDFRADAVVTETRIYR